MIDCCLDGPSCTSRLFAYFAECTRHTRLGNPKEATRWLERTERVEILLKKGRLFEKQRRTLAGLKAGDRVLVEPFHLELEHDQLTVVEELRKVD